jgi:DNA-binding transcriptional ArsR family regulator
MQVSGRDVEDTAYTLVWDIDCCSWTITEKEALKPSIPEAQQLIIDILESEDRNWTTAEIIAKTGKTKQAVSNTLSKLKENNLILNPIYGQWHSKSKYTGTLLYRESVPVYSSNETKTVTAEPEPVETTAEPKKELDIY